MVELEAAEKLAVLEKERREVEALRKKNERLLRNLHPINEKEDLRSLPQWNGAYPTAVPGG